MTKRALDQLFINALATAPGTSERIKRLLLSLPAAEDRRYIWQLYRRAKEANR